MDSPRVIGARYELVRLLGKGGMGEVHEAIDREAKRRVAVKLLAELPRDAGEESEKRFAREILATAQVASRHVVGVHDAGVDGRPYMVVDLLDGEDVGAIADRLGALPVDVALRIAAQTCEGLLVAHAAGIVHRDIKPSNLFLVAPTASGRIVKILDFGIARVRFAGANRTELTQTGALLGSPLYMAPEQFRGDRALDHRADVWSLGVVLYRLLCGRVPHERDSFGDLLMTVCSEPAPDLRARAPWVPSEVAALVHRALAIDADARTPTIRALADALAKLLPDGTEITDDMLVAQRIQVREPPASDVRHDTDNRRPLSVASETMLAPVQHAVRPVAPPEPVVVLVERPAPRRGRLVWAVLAAVVIIGGAVVVATRSRPTDAPKPVPKPSPPAPGPHPLDFGALDADIPGNLRNTPGSEWWARVRTRCTPAGYRDALATKPDTVDGTAFAIGCATLAGDLALAKQMLDSSRPLDRVRTTGVLAACARNMYIHDDRDPAALAAAELGLTGWPHNVHLLYLAGVMEFEAGKPDDARAHLEAFLRASSSKDDEFAKIAQGVLALLAKRDCTREIRDHWNRVITQPGC